MHYFLAQKRKKSMFQRQNIHIFFIFLEENVKTLE